MLEIEFAGEAPNHFPSINRSKNEMEKTEKYFEDLVSDKKANAILLTLEEPQTEHMKQFIQERLNDFVNVTKKLNIPFIVSMPSKEPELNVAIYKDKMKLKLAVLTNHLDQTMTGLNLGVLERMRTNSVTYDAEMPNRDDFKFRDKYR